MLACFILGSLLLRWQITHKSTEWCSGQPTGQLISHSASQSASQSASHSASQPVITYMVAFHRLHNGCHWLMACTL